MTSILKNFEKMEEACNYRLSSNSIDYTWFKKTCETLGSECFEVIYNENITRDLHARLVKYILNYLGQGRTVEGGCGSTLIYYKEQPHRGHQYDTDYCDTSSIHHY